MNLGIMQPYFLPYLGYWQLINAVDIFVIYDDVNFKKRSWISRNKILIDGSEKIITLKLSRASQSKLINGIELFDDEVYSNKLIKTIKQCYGKAPYYENVMPLIESVIKKGERNLAKYLANSIIQVCRHLEIETQILTSSEIKKNNYLKGQDKIIEICRKLSADGYINPVSGMDLYSGEDFIDAGIQLKFLKPVEVNYKQFNKDFVSNLSIIDVLMFNSSEEIRKLLDKYKIIYF